MDVPNTPQSCRLSLPETPIGASPGDLAGLVGHNDHDDGVMLENEPTGTVIEVHGSEDHDSLPSEISFERPAPRMEAAAVHDVFPVPPLPPIQTSESYSSHHSDSTSMKASGSLPLSVTGSLPLPQDATEEPPSDVRSGENIQAGNGGQQFQAPVEALAPAAQHPAYHLRGSMSQGALHTTISAQPGFDNASPIPMQNGPVPQNLMMQGSHVGQQQQQPSSHITMPGQQAYPSQNGSFSMGPSQPVYAPNSAHNNSVQNPAPAFSPAPNYVQASQPNGHGPATGVGTPTQVGQGYANYNTAGGPVGYQDGSQHRPQGAQQQPQVVAYNGQQYPADVPQIQHQRAHSMQHLAPQQYNEGPQQQHANRAHHHHHHSHGPLPLYPEEHLSRSHSRSGSHNFVPERAPSTHSYNLEQNISRANSQSLAQQYYAPYSYANSIASSPSPGPIERAISGVPSETSLASKVDFVQQSDSVRKLVNQCKLWTREISDMMGELENLRVEHLQTQIKDLKEDVSQRDELVKSLTEERDGLSKEKEDNEKKIEEVEEENAALNRESDDLKRALASKNSIIDRLRMEYEQLLTELEQKDQMVQQLTRAHSEETEEARKQRVVSGLLIELKPATFERTFCKIVELFYTNPMLLCVLVDKIFENALQDFQTMDSYADMVAKLQPVLPEFDDPDAPENAQSKLTFSRFLMAKCQEEFEDGCKAMDMVNQKNADPSLNKALQAAYMRSLTVIQFIGCLFKKNAVPEAIVHKCIVKMLQVELPRAQEVEAICRLFITIGPALHHVPKARSIMEAYFGQIEMFTRNHMLNPRLRLQLLDLIDLRSNNWILRSHAHKNSHGGPQMA